MSLLSYFTLSDLVSTDLVSSELSALCLFAAAANWVASQRTTRFAVAATYHSTISCRPTRRSRL